MSSEAMYIGELETMCGREYKDDERGWLKSRLHKGDFTREAFVRALKDFEAEDNFYLPNPKRALAFVERAHHELSPKINRREEMPKQDQRQFEMARAIRQMIFSGKYTRQQIIDKMKEADGIRPDTGWMTATRELHEYYNKTNLDMNSPPANHIHHEVSPEKGR
jgi:hypothetical protein